MPNIKSYSTEDRRLIKQRLIALIESKTVKKCQVAAECGISWLLVHRISTKNSLPHQLTCMILEPWLNRHEDLKVKENKP